MVEGERKTSAASSVSSAMSEMTAEVMKQKEEMIHCLQDELIKERLREAENEEKIRNLLSKVLDIEMENKKLRETVPENEVASLQEQLAAAKLREAEANLALKELRSKVAELSGMWQKHLKRKSLVRKSKFYKMYSIAHLCKDFKIERTFFPLNELFASIFQEQKRVLEAGEGAGDDGSSSVVAPSTPKKLLGSLLEAGGLTKSEVTRLEEEMMSIRMSEVGAQAELKDQKLKVMELETEVSRG